jgi:hypothetical protein
MQSRLDVDHIRDALEGGQVVDAGHDQVKQFADVSVVV